MILLNSFGFVFFMKNCVRFKSAKRLLKETLRRLLHPEKYKSVGFLCDYLGDEVTINDPVKAIRQKKVTNICTFQSDYPSKDSACLVYINPVYGNNDTLKYAERAMQRGALVLITDRCYSDYPCIVSKDPIKTYAFLCKYYRELQSKVRITAVTGSIGKTTTKNMIAEVYKTSYKTLYTEENNNTKTTVGFAVQHIPNWAEMMVQEVHEGEPNETQWLSLMLHPTVAVITSIDNSHYQFFGSADKIIEECCAITKYMSETGIVIVNKDEFTRFDLLNGRRIMTISLFGGEADFSASNIELDNDGITFIVHVKDNGACAKVRLNYIFAKHNVISALYAFAAGYCQGVPVESIIHGLSNYRTSGIRQNIIKTLSGVTLYVDCYNAVAKSMKSAIEACDSISVSGKRIAVLGDIAEVGDLSESMHEDVISFINKSKFDILLTIGDKMKKATEAISNRDSLLIESFDDRAMVSDRLRALTASGDLVLFKASNASNLKECVLRVWPETEPYVNNKKHK